MIFLIFQMMKGYFSLTRCFIFLATFLIGTSCNGQAQKDIPKERATESAVISSDHPKLRKTQSKNPGDNVHCSLQDKAGNLWFGTTGDGIYKYDGKAFVQFTTANGLNGNTVWSILEDKEGKIWIGTEAGVCLYDGKTFTAIHIPLSWNLPPNTKRNTHDVFDIMQDKSGKLWFATIDGVYNYDGKSFSSFKVKEHGPGFMSSNPNVENLLEDKAGNFWFGGRDNEGVYRYDGKSITNLEVKEPEFFNWARPVLVDKKGNVWFINWSGAYRYDGKSTKKFSNNNGLNIDAVTCIIEDKSGNLWLGGKSGLCRYDGTNFTCYSKKDGLINNDVWSILEDRTGNLWIGTRNTSLYRYDGKSFISFSE
jgi:ligand-binding sensor domain-containing protein